jgi:hypothetical protein
MIVASNNTVQALLRSSKYLKEGFSGFGMEALTSQRLDEILIRMNQELRLWSHQFQSSMGKVGFDTLRSREFREALQIFLAVGRDFESGMKGFAVDAIQSQEFALFMKKIGELSSSLEHVGYATVNSEGFQRLVNAIKNIGLGTLQSREFLETRDLFSKTATDVSENLKASAENIGQNSMKVVESIACFFVFFLILDKMVIQNIMPLTLRSIHHEDTISGSIELFMLIAAFVACYCSLPKIWIYVKAPYGTQSLGNIRSSSRCCLLLVSMERCC